MAKKIPVKKKAVLAKGKARAARLADESDAAEKHLAKQAEVTGKKADVAKLGKNEIPTNEILNVWASELQTIYEEFGSRLDFTNAKDKARTLLIELRCHTPTVSISEHEYDLPDCGRHDED